MQKKYISGRNLSNSISSEDILGKDVIDIDGNYIGVVEKVSVDPKLFTFSSISIDKGFFKKGLTLGSNYIDRVEEHAVFLKIRVAYEIKGKIVFDVDGIRVGVVSGIDLQGNKNKIKSIHVTKNLLYALIGKELIIPLRFIKSIGDNVILNISKATLFSK